MFYARLGKKAEGSRALQWNLSVHNLRMLPKTILKICRGGLRGAGWRTKECGVYIYGWRQNYTELIVRWSTEDISAYPFEMLLRPSL
jgi:hypothetical protein